MGKHRQTGQTGADAAMVTIIGDRENDLYAAWATLLAPNCHLIIRLMQDRCELRRKRFVLVLFQPAQVRAYAKFRLRRAKNDKIDPALMKPPAQPVGICASSRPHLGSGLLIPIARRTAHSAA